MHIKKIGLIAGISWPASVVYYHEINRYIAGQTSPQQSARLTMESVNIRDVLRCLERDDRPALEHLLGNAARLLLASGADIIAIGSNTLHDYGREVRSCSGKRFAPITDALGRELRARNIGRVGLLGTCHTMQNEDYKDQLRRHVGEVLVPDPVSQARLDRIIFEHIIHGNVSAADNRYYREQSQRLLDAGADAVILGCTDLSTLDLDPLPTSQILDSTRIHARYLADIALQGLHGVEAA